MTNHNLIDYNETTIQHSPHRTILCSRAQCAQYSIIQPWSTVTLCSDLLYTIRCLFVYLQKTFNALQHERNNKNLHKILTFFWKKTCTIVHILISVTYAHISLNYISGDRINSTPLSCWKRIQPTMKVNCLWLIGSKRKCSLCFVCLRLKVKITLGFTLKYSRFEVRL